MGDRVSDSRAWRAAAVAALLLFASSAARAQVAVQGVDNTTSPATLSPVARYRWTLEHNTMYRVRPGVPDPKTLAVRFHQSYTPVVATGTEASSPFAAIAAYEAKLAPCALAGWQPCYDPNDRPRYYLSVLPASDYSVGGADIAAGQTRVTVFVNAWNIPTAQIAIVAFPDRSPLNNELDLPDEDPAGNCPGPDCMGGFTVTLYDLGGRDGISGGPVSVDFFGNPLGTTYRPCTAQEIQGGNCPIPGNKTVNAIGAGVLKTDAGGRCTIKNISPGKYDVAVIPPPGSGWVQTSTLEGTRKIEAFVKANEPPFFQEFGPPDYHVKFGFIQPFTDKAALKGGATITGRIVNGHQSHPPDPAVFPGDIFPGSVPWVALNDTATGNGRVVYAQRANVDGTFAIANVPPGNYTLAVWDDNLDIIFDQTALTVPPNTPQVALGDKQVLSWFTRSHHYVFEDVNENGIWDLGEQPISDQVINLRFRDGSVWDSNVTNADGFVGFNELFPFFAWQVAEVDYTRFKATGLTVVVDGGGRPDPNATWPAQVGVDPKYAAQINPQIQSENNNLPYRWEQGAVITEAFQGFIGQTNLFLWGKKAFGPSDVDNPPYCSKWLPDGTCENPDEWPSAVTDVDGNVLQDPDIDDGCLIGVDTPGCPHNGSFDANNGGISGILSYDTTRAEDDPTLGTMEPWQPGIPNARFQLFYDKDGDGAADDLDDDGDPDPIAEAAGDSWDRQAPTNCQGPGFTFKGQPTDCYDGLRNWNQIRPGVYDGAYAFFSHFEPYLGAPGAVELPWLFAGDYIVKVILPPGYEIVREEDKNVNFGDVRTPGGQGRVKGAPVGRATRSGNGAALTNPFNSPPCVGALHTLPAELDLYPGVPIITDYLTDADPNTPGFQTHLCDAREVTLNDGGNVGANFFAFTRAPVAGHVYGFILDDSANETDPVSPQFGEKYAPPWLPISIRDWTGREISRTYSDEYGVFDALVPSTTSINPPIPSGVAPNMMTACMNDPTIQNLDGTFSPDPFFNPHYSQFCYTWQYDPGLTTYLDTPVLPVGSFVGPDQAPVDCEAQAGTPVINRVTGPASAGPFVPYSANLAARTLTIVSAGSVQVQNPAYAGVSGNTPKTIARDYGFGNAGLVTLGGIPIPTLNWTPGQIIAVVPPGLPTGELLVTRFDTGATSLVGVTVTVARTNAENQAVRRVSAGQKIQPVIDAANPGDLILVAPGYYPELLVMWKPVRLQGWGAASTVISATKTPSENLDAWRRKTQQLLTDASYLLPGQTGCTPGPNCYNGIEPVLLFNEEGPGVIVLGRSVGQTNPAAFGLVCGNGQRPLLGFCPFNAGPAAPNSRIDGFTITGGDNAGAILINAYAHYMEVANTRLAGNQGVFGGGIRAGYADLTVAANNGETYVSAGNDHLAIHHNHLLGNSSTEGNGGGIGLYTGSDQYRVQYNFLCGNFAGGSGGAIAHTGLSNGGVIADNIILYNETFNQSADTHGAGIFVGGQPGIGGLTAGSGNVQIRNNLIQGNQAGTGDGGGIRLQNVNGADLALPAILRWNVDVFNNMIVNNMAGMTGGGISLQDVVNARIIHNTIAHNDSLATAGAAFVSRNATNALPGAGIVARAHSAGLAAASGRTFPDPLLVNDIIRDNRSFHYGAVPGFPPLGILPVLNYDAAYHVPGGSPANIVSDLAVLGTANANDRLHPRYSILTSGVGYDNTNITVDPAFHVWYFNGNRGLVNNIELGYTGTGVAAPAAFDEGGNFVRPMFGPLTVTVPGTSNYYGNYHIDVSHAGQPLYGQGGIFQNLLTVPPALLIDYDGQLRPNVGADRGADQRVAGPIPGINPFGLIRPGNGNNNNNGRHDDDEEDEDR